MRTGNPSFLIRIVSNIPVYLNCSNTTSRSYCIGAFSEFGFTQRTKYGLHRDIVSISESSDSEKLAATVGVRGFMVTNRPVVLLNVFVINLSLISLNI